MEKETQGNINEFVSNPNVDGASFNDKDVCNSPLTAFDIFQKCIKRAENLIEIPSFISEEKDVEHNCDCYRAAIVLSISALDAFVKKIVISEIFNQLTRGKTIPTPLRDYVKQLLNQDKLLDAARKSNFNEILEKEINEDFEKKSFQGEWKIDTYLKMIGHENIFSEVCVKRDINEKNFRKNIEFFTKRRHIIAHSGDFDLNRSPLEENKITIEDAKLCVQTVTTFAQTINEIINN